MKIFPAAVETQLAAGYRINAISAAVTTAGAARKDHKTINTLQK